MLEVNTEIQFHVEAMKEKVTGKIVQVTDYETYMVEVEFDNGDIQKYEVEPQYLEWCTQMGKTITDGYHRIPESLPGFEEPVILKHDDDRVEIGYLAAREYARGRGSNQYFVLDLYWYPKGWNFGDIEKWCKIPEDKEKEA